MSGAWERNKNDVVILIPHQTYVSMNWAIGFRKLKPQSCDYILNRGVPIDVSRNILAMEALERGYKWLFFLDSDIIPPEDALLKLLSHNLDIVSGLYYKRYPPIHPAMWFKLPKPTPKGKYAPILNYPPNQIIEADVIGMGCTLIHRRVFEKLKPPYFKWTNFWVKNGVSEDFYFCEKAKEVGFKVYVDTSVKCDHEFLGKAVAQTDNSAQYISHIDFVDV